MKKVFGFVITVISATTIGIGTYVPKSYANKVFVCNEYKTKIPGLSQKAQKSDIPRWAKSYTPCRNPNQNGNAFAKYIMDIQYPGMKHETGPDTEYNKIKKHVDAAWKQ